MQNIIIFFYFTLLCACLNTVTSVSAPRANDTLSNDSHLKYEHVRARCARRTEICAGGGARVCAVRMLGAAGLRYRDFVNSCYLFMSNMCERAGREFHIASGGSCKQYLASRRNSPHAPKTNITEDSSTNHVSSTSVRAGRTGQTSTLSTLYDIDTAFDFHTCPASCPDTYEPVCVSVNRGSGLHFKFYTFVNHCAGDLYYCKHWQEFSPPPNEEENVVSSKLGWSFCGASRYLQFARFSEVASSMGHYGWLAGDYRYSHIMEPHQRARGYG